MHSPGTMQIHRAWDSAHDPLFGLLATTHNGTLSKWVPHMVHDFLTPMSLPLPGVAHSEALRFAYVAGFNLRTVVAVPLLAVGGHRAGHFGPVPGAQAHGAAVGGGPHRGPGRGTSGKDGPSASARRGARSPSAFRTVMRVRHAVTVPLFQLRVPCWVIRSLGPKRSSERIPIYPRTLGWDA
jgi:hypothetical protein